MKGNNNTEINSGNDAETHKDKRYRAAIYVLSFALVVAITLIFVPLIQNLIPEPFDPHLGVEQIREAEMREQIYDRQEEFSQLDIDGDSFLSVDEYYGLEKLFQGLDTNGDERLSPEEAKYMMTFVEIPTGSFVMGTDEPINFANQDIKNMMPAHEVEVDGFLMAATEVTAAQYVLFLNSALEAREIVVELESNLDDIVNKYIRFTHPFEEQVVKGAPGTKYAGLPYIRLTHVSAIGHHESHINGLLMPEHPLNRSWIMYHPEANSFFVQPGYEDFPVAFAKYWGAMAFAEHFGLSLPTEAEWEYAASGGQQFDYGTSDGTAGCQRANYGCYNAMGVPNYQGVDTIDEFVGFRIAVGSYPANPYGVYDLAGNVWEWTMGWFDAGFYQYVVDNGITSNPIKLEGEEPPMDGSAIGGPAIEFSHDSHVLRGGNWNYSDEILRVQYRMQAYSFISNDHIGFRIISRSPDVVFNGTD